MEVGRGGACVPARVALQGRIHRLQVCIMRNAQTFLRMETPPLRVGDVPFADGNASFADGRRAFCGWKRRCADVRAGTQAPPLPFLVWLHVPRLAEEALPTD